MKRSLLSALLVTPSFRIVIAIAALSPLFAAGVWAQGGACLAADNGTGTVTLPPAGCGYVSPQQLHMILNGLPPGTTIQIDPIHNRFICLNPGCGQPGGTLGGDVELFQSNLKLRMTGTGALAGFVRTLDLDVDCETHTAPRTPGAPKQSFQTRMFRLQGGLTGDPDFQFLSVVAGDGNGLPSPGQTTLVELGDGRYFVDSVFNIAYRITFQGAQGSVLAGLSGTTQGTAQVVAQGPPEPVDPCLVPAEDDMNTIRLPPPGCEYLGPAQIHRIINGLPAGTTIEIDARHAGFFPGGPPEPGGTHGGAIERFASTLILDLHGTGALEGFERTLRIPVACETHTGPRDPSLPLQSIPTEMFRLQGSLPAGDPDFSQLKITAGTGNGLPSPGKTTLIKQPGDYVQVDSLFEITYRINFVGAPGGVLAGLAGATEAQITMVAHSSSTCDPEAGTNAIFCDDFESADTFAWSNTVPVP